MIQQTVTGWALLSLFMSTLVLSYPQTSPAASSQIAAQYITKSAIDQQQQQFMRHAPQRYRLQGRAPQYDQQFTDESNALYDIDTDNRDKQIQDNLSSWSNMIGSLLTMLFNNAQMGGTITPAKSEDFDASNQIVPSPWTNAISVGLRIITALLGGGTSNDGIDKDVNGGAQPMQNILAAVLSGVLGAKDPDQVNTMAKQAGEFINIVANLMNTLKTSTSQRSLAAI